MKRIQVIGIIVIMIALIGVLIFRHNTNAGGINEVPKTTNLASLEKPAASNAPIVTTADLNRVAAEQNQRIAKMIGITPA